MCCVINPGFAGGRPVRRNASPAAMRGVLCVLARGDPLEQS